MWFYEMQGAQNMFFVFLLVRAFSIVFYCVLPGHRVLCCVLAGQRAGGGNAVALLHVPEHE